MIRKKGFWQGLLFLFLALVLASSMLLAACGDGDDEDDDWTPIATESPTATPTETAKPTETATPTMTYTPSGECYPIPDMPVDWQELPAEQRDAYNVNFYVPGDWDPNLSMPPPTIVLMLTPNVFFPNAELRSFNMEAGSTNEQVRDHLLNTYPSENGGEFDNFEVLDQGDMTLDNGMQLPYLVFKGTKMGYSTTSRVIFFAQGTNGIALSGNDYIPVFSESEPLLIQMLKTFHSTIPCTP